MLTPQDSQLEAADAHLTQEDVDVEATLVEKSLVDAEKSEPTEVNKEPSTSLTTLPEPELPSIGLSTPLAYYTPLKDLVFFLNRSSQFHSSANPDTLALVTSQTTPSEKAKKGPKHWNTTLRITDASIWPATTSVNLFRAYQSALPHADVGDVILLRSFAVKSMRRQPMLISADESSWCVWRFGRPMWGAKRGAFGEIKAREEIKGPEVERGEGEWREVERLRNWYTGKIKSELDKKQVSHVRTRSKDLLGETGEEEDASQVSQTQQSEGAVQEEEKSENKRMTRSQGKVAQP